MHAAGEFDRGFEYHEEPRSGDARELGTTA